MEEVTKCHCHTGKRPLAQIVEWKSESQSKSGGQGFPFLPNHSARGVGASSSLSVTTTTGIVASPTASIRSLEAFPTDVIINILSRLPAKSLMCCRCVCKIWRNIIDSPYFSNMHFTSNRAHNTQEPPLMLVCRTDSRPKNIILFSLMDDGTQVLRSSEFPISKFANSNHYIMTFLCYDLFCFVNRHDRAQAFLLNPLRGEVLMLPPAMASAGPSLQYFFGVGFDCTTETYKVVHVYQLDVYRLDLMPVLATKVYTLGTSSWREIPAVPPLPCCLYGMPVSAYGDVHWLGYNLLLDGKFKNMIISFDTRKEEFKLTPHPNLPQEHLKSFHLLYFRGHLAIVDMSSLTHLEVWMLKDYDKKEWAIEYRISAELFVGQDIRLPARMLATVICIGAWEHGLLFKTWQYDLVYYNPKTDSVKVMSVQPNVSVVDKKIIGYNGSLVSLKNAGNMVAREAGQRNYFNLSTIGPVFVFP